MSRKRTTVRKWFTIGEMLALHPERKRKVGVKRSPKDIARIWKRKNAVVRDRLVNGMKYEDIAKKHGISASYATMLVSQYRKWERDQV